MAPEIELKVAEAMQIDYGKRVVRIDSTARKLLGVTTGDVVEIRGKKTTAAIVLPAHPADEGLNLLRMDGILRQNSGVGLGDRVKIRKAEIKPAKKIVLAPNQPTRYAPGFDQYVKKNLVGKPLQRGDVLSVNVFGTAFPFAVAQTVPVGLTIATEETQVELQEEPMKELGRIPTITYEDIGGMKDDIQKVREMVELPMRHPELFERLGIEPPKGVLLYGPPGSGKTLLAKAVANESEAHFITINGPEVISKFVGEAEERLRGIFAEAEENAPSIIFIDELDAITPKREEVVGEVERRIVSQMLCVAPETKIHLPDRVVPIKQLYDEQQGKKTVEDEVEYVHPIGLRVLGLDARGTIASIPVTAMNRLFVPDTFQVTLEDGSKATVSAIQRFCTLENGEFTWTPITDLRAGDYVAVPTELPEPSLSPVPLPWQQLPDSFTLRLAGGLAAVMGRNYASVREVKEFLSSGVVPLDGTLRTTLLRLVQQKGVVSASQLLTLAGASPSKGNDDGARRLLLALQELGSLTIAKNGQWLTSVQKTSARFSEADITGVSAFTYFKRFLKNEYFFTFPSELTPELAEFIGYVAADGSVTKNRVNVSGKPEVVERAAVLAKNLFGARPNFKRLNERCYRMDVACQTLPQLLHHYFGFPIGKKSHSLRAPVQLFASPRDVVAAFVRAYVDCDASAGTSIRIFSRSKGMMDDMSRLLLQLGFRSNRLFTLGMHYCTIAGGTGAMREYAERIGSVRADRIAHFASLLNSRKVGSRISIVPNIQSALNALRPHLRLADNDYRYLSGNLNVSKNKLAYFLSLQKGSSEAAQSLRHVLEAQVAWVKITSVEKGEPMEMYDLTTVTENFVAGDNPLLLHNTCMDGLKSRGQVVVIGASNRPNSIDPALRRPGRFDREIEIGVPDKRGRKEILQIHTRGMPLEKDVSLDDMAAVTHGFVGADLQMLCKEAAMKVLRRILPKVDLDKEIPQSILEAITVTRNDFEQALREVQPSALREVYVEVPNVKWEQIGGLDEIKRELKEAVELPLKRPEVFSRVGIRPVRGILLYGPPGTGKTLLAKAVATESEANFIAVRGPELISKWVGDSLAYDEPVLVFENGIPKFKQIGTFEEEVNANQDGGQLQIERLDIKAATVDDDMKVTEARLLGVIRHPAPSSLYKIRTASGREIQTTGDHAFFVLHQGKLAEIEARSVIPNETVIAAPARINLGGGFSPQIDLIELLKDDPHVFVEPNEFVDSAVDEFGPDAFAKAAGFSDPSYLAYRRDKGKLTLSVRAFRNAAEKLGFKFKPEKLRVFARGSAKSMPARITLDENWAFLLGIWTAEGDYNYSASVRIHNQNPENRLKITEACRKIGMDYSQSSDTITICSHFVESIFLCLGAKPYAQNKRIPPIIFTLPRASRSAFLRGYYSGDGSVYGNSHRFIIEASTEGRDLASDVMYLLLDYGIVATHYSRRDKRYEDLTMHKVQFSGVDNFRKFKEIGFSDAKRNSRVGEYLSNKKWERSSQIPLDAGLREFAARNGLPEWSTSRSIGRKKLLGLLAEVDPGRLRRDYWRIAEAEIYWDRVVSVERVPYDKPFTYDLSVEGTQRFLGGYGGLLIHNSEKGIREVFRKARTSAPTIIFFDEIDAIAPARGGDDGDSHVTERMVNTLLAEMDGLSNLKDVVVIAATNRADILDPAVLRPGRFDKLLMIPAPDEKTRFDILKVHSAKMPLSKSVSLAELARKTEGYSGADLESLCREAGMNALRDNLNASEVLPKHFEKALSAIRPTLLLRKSKDSDAGYL